MDQRMDYAAPSSMQGGSSHDLDPIMRAIAAGNRRALADLYGRTSAKLYGICLRLLGDESEAEDVLQDVYVTAWQKAGRFDPAKASLITWLGVIARNKAIDRLRVRRFGTTHLDDAGDMEDDGPSAFDVLEVADQRARLAACLDELEDKHQAMIRSAFLDGVTYPELAQTHAVPIGTMKSWIRRSLLRLRGCLQR